MSHDQRPARMRVVKDPTALGQRQGDTATIDAIAEAVASVEAAAAAGAIGSKGLPLLPAGLFLLACAAGGVLVAIVRPLGLG